MHVHGKRKAGFLRGGSQTQACVCAAALVFTTHQQITQALEVGVCLHGGGRVPASGSAAGGSNLGLAERFREFSNMSLRYITSPSIASTCKTEELSNWNLKC